ncbi:hypothetical protein NVV93_12535 [Pseudomonas sp. LS44]|uniref:hypothetical protein n=1 Tax=Pseudomonas sp. LS44 TaxID=1357074 RepID=UPI00215AC3F9|nr:hypothetical protein [Pseudomonas sp. LS44]UVE16438.1 hypothetical protein NVV93_12535 [Pseudomonas sp. LS44]
MSQIPKTARASRHEMRKALVRLRLEMHRQEIRHESQLVIQPLHKARGLATNWSKLLGLPRAPLWSMAGIAALGLFSSKGGGIRRLIRVGTLVYPMLMMVLRRQSDAAPTTPPDTR